MRAMADFAQTLRQARLDLGYKAAKSFYAALDEHKVSFNYSYYMRIEQGKTLPSAKVVQEIASFLGGMAADTLIRSYCRSLFPKFPHIFQGVDESRIKIDEKSTEVSIKQKEMTEKDIAVLIKSRSHYYMFVLITLARREMTYSELNEYFKADELEKVIQDLLKEQLLLRSETGVRSVSIESKFPKAESQSIKKAYAQMDEWDQEFGQQFQLETLVDKFFLRRISLRYITVIEKQLDALFELVKSSNEIDHRYNDQVMQLKVSLKTGRLPG